MTAQTCEWMLRFCGRADRHFLAPMWDEGAINLLRVAEYADSWLQHSACLGINDGGDGLAQVGSFHPGTPDCPIASWFGDCSRCRLILWGIGSLERGHVDRNFAIRAKIGKAGPDRTPDSVVGWRIAWARLSQKEENNCGNGRQYHKYYPEVRFNLSPRLR